MICCLTISYWSPNLCFWENMMFKRRLGPPPHEGGESGAVNSCPDLWELESGDFAVIGFERTAQLLPHLPDDAFVDPGEAIVVIPRKILVKARKNIPRE